MTLVKPPQRALWRCTDNRADHQPRTTNRTQLVAVILRVTDSPHQRAAFYIYSTLRDRPHRSIVGLKKRIPIRIGGRRFVIARCVVATGTE